MMLYSVVMLGAILLIGEITNAKEPPNIVIFLADDLGWNDVSFHGSRQIPTPNIDALAYDGIIFDNYYVQPICSPSRAAILTARYPIHLGLQHGVINGCRRYGLGLNETILPQHLKELGYSTHGLGKWHLGFYTDQYVPSNRGFDTYFGMYAGTGDYWSHCYNVDGHGKWNGYGLDLHLNNRLVKDQFGVYSTNMFTSSAEDIIENHNTSQPLFIYFAEQAVHAAPITTLEAPWKYVKHFNYIKSKNRQTYAGMVSALDDSVRNVTKALYKRGMLNNTIIVFTTDNGGPVNTAGPNSASNYPLRGEKTTLWEGGVRGSSFIWSPLLKNSGRISHQLMHITDWLPTLLHAAGYDTAKLDKAPIDGIDMWDSLSLDLPSKRKEILLNIDPVNSASGVRVGNYKLLYHGGNGSAQWFPQPQLYVDEEVSSLNLLLGGVADSNSEVSFGIEQGRLTEEETVPNYMFYSEVDEILQQLGRGKHEQPNRPLVVDCGPKPANASWNCNLKKKPCVYDIINDPCEYNNLADSRPDLVSALMARLQAYNVSMAPMKNKPIDPEGLPVNNGWAFQPWVKPSDDISY